MSTAILTPMSPEPSEVPADAGRRLNYRHLAAVHAVGVVHRDVKPANVLMRRPGDPVLLDLGIVRMEAEGTPFTPEGVLLGTPAFMAPELFAGGLASPASDQFAWAATLVAAAGGAPVYGVTDVAGILKAGFGATDAGVATARAAAVAVPQPGVAVGVGLCALATHVFHHAAEVRGLLGAGLELVELVARAAVVDELVDEWIAAQ